MKKIIKYILLVVILIVSLLVLTGCEKNTSTNEMPVAQKKSTSNSTSSNSTTSDTTSDDENYDDVDYASAAEKQMSMPEIGDQVAIFHIKDYGDIKVKFFEDVAPKAVENFVTHAKEGYYNGLTFHRVIDEFMIQGGDPLGNGTGGESIWGEGFGTELDKTLVPYRGSLCMAMSSLPNSIGSQFFITQANYDESTASYYKTNGYPEGLLEQYKTYGGSLHLYMQYTVFGQVYEGLEIVDKIASVDTDSNDKPLEDVIIESIEVTTYDGN